MNLYVDCEFNGFGGQLISLALVADDGREWYGVLPEPRVWDKWCFENVLPVLYEEPVIITNTRDEFLSSMHGFLSQFQNPTIVADWYTDLMHFFSCFEGKDHATSFAYACQATLPKGLKGNPEIPHNALSDARAIRDAFQIRAAA